MPSVAPREYFAELLEIGKSKAPQTPERLQQVELVIEQFLSELESVEDVEAEIHRVTFVNLVSQAFIDPSTSEAARLVLNYAYLLTDGKHLTRERVTVATRSREVDAQVGRRVRERRNALGMSQEKLGNVLGVSFQQIQKYEAGIVRVAASRLWDITEALEVDVAYFFEGIEKRAKRKAKPRKRPTKAKRTKPRKRRN